MKLSHLTNNYLEYSIKKEIYYFILLNVLLLKKVKIVIVLPHLIDFVLIRFIQAMITTIILHDTKWFSGINECLLAMWDLFILNRPIYNINMFSPVVRKIIRLHLFPLSEWTV